MKIEFVLEVKAVFFDNEAHFYFFCIKWNFFALETSNF